MGRTWHSSPPQQLKAMIWGGGRGGGAERLEHDLGFQRIHAISRFRVYQSSMINVSAVSPRLWKLSLISGSRRSLSVLVTPVKLAGWVTRHGWASTEASIFLKTVGPFFETLQLKTIAPSLMPTTIGSVVHISFTLPTDTFSQFLLLARMEWWEGAVLTAVPSFGQRCVCG